MKRTGLLEFGFATFHTAFFLAAVIALVYSTGNLGQLLANLNTLIGLALFGVLWLSTWWCTRSALRQVDEKALDQPLASSTDIIRVLMLSALWGGMDGLLFLGVLLSGGLLFAVYSLIAAPSLTPPFFLFLFGVFGLPVAFIVGAVIGILFALIDGALLQVSRILFALSQSS